MAIRRLVYTALFAIVGFTAMAQYVSEVWVADRGDGTYRNPIIHADYSDPEREEEIAVTDEMYVVDLPGYGYAQANENVKAQWGKMIEDYLHKSKMPHH